MTRLIRWPLLLAALIAFTLEVATVANLRCDMTQAERAAASQDHVWHSGHGSQVPSPTTHRSGACICVAGCHMGLGLRGPVVSALAEPGPAVPETSPSQPTPPLPLAARPFALPLSHAPPFLA